MKILVIGDSASGKSTFASKLAAKLSLPVVHLDEIMDSMGRTNKESIRFLIESEIAKQDWIMDGNAFTKDKEGRIRAADLIIAFDFHPLKSLVNHILRYLKLFFGVEKRTGSSNVSLNLRYFIPYIFLKFPKRKKEAIGLARSLGKEVVIFRTRTSSDTYLLAP